MPVRLWKEVQEVLREQELTLSVGRFRLALLSDGLFRLDGGAMYGVVPKTLWCRSEPETDDKNRILLDLGCLLITTPRGKNVLVDTGLSSKYDDNPKFKNIYAVDRLKTLRDSLKTQGLRAEDIDVVINTHLHFDHAGGNTEKVDGKIVPAFPNARYLIQKKEWDAANHPHERNAASYLDENFAVLEDSGRLELVDGEAELEPGLKIVRSGGHSEGHQIVTIESEGRCGVYLGDLVPTRAHVPLPFVMAYDLHPVDTLEFKRRLYEKALAEDWLLLFDHDNKRRHARLSKDASGRYTARE